MTRVSITSVGEDVFAAFALAMARADCDGVISRGDCVVVKPNWNGCAIPGSTSLAVVEAACRWALGQGAGEVVVGEGPVPVGKEAVEKYLAEMGARERLDAVGARFVNFDDEEHVLFKDREDLPSEIGVAKRALDCDVLINAPIMKVHTCCLNTLCIKNLKGCTRPEDKMAFHRTGLLPAVIALNRIIPSHINVIDAIDAMEGNHNNGPLVHLGLLVAGRNRVATDAVGGALMGLPPEKVPLVKMAGEAGLGVWRLEDIETVGEPLEPRKLELPQEHLARHYPDLEIVEAAACSACGAALMDGLFTAGGERKVGKIALGSKAEPPEDALVLGKCLRDYWPTHAHVEGCPPSGADVARALKQGPGGPNA
ncbi:MAG TPA: DUF362 domain-containing protein [Sumerlaeia bacterium]|nr:DUF362 domain-containing protein [Sumerlaeia bacterium]